MITQAFWDRCLKQYKIQRILENGENASEEEIAALVLHYVDDYTRGTDWAKPAEVNKEGEKIDDLNRRVEAAFNNPKYKLINEGGKEYFEGKISHEVQEAVGEFVERFLATRIAKTKGVNIDPKDLPAIIDEKIKKEIAES